MEETQVDKGTPTRPMDMYKLVVFFLLISGASSLMYQVLWSKILLYLFGNSVYSATAVVASFMLGLGIGSYILGKYSDKIKSKLGFYGVLEICIALSSGLGYFFLSRYIYDFYSIFYHDPSGSLLAVKFLLASFVVFIPALFMGGTFPVILSFFAKEDSIKGVTSKLYGINTLGAVLGTILSGFFLLELIGIKATFIVAMALNIIIGLWAIIAAKKKKPSAVDGNQVIDLDKHYDVEPVKGYKKIVLILFFLSGFLSLSYEIIWMRLFAPIIGNFTYSFASILIVFLLGIALGSYAVKRVKIKKPFLVVGLAEFVIGIASIAVLFSINNISVNTTQHALFSLPAFAFFALFVTTLLMGIIFPIMYEISFMGDSKDKVGTKAGMLYAVNTIGSVLGIMLTGLIFLAMVGGSKLVFLFATFNCILGITFVLLDKKWLKEKAQKIFVYGGAIIVLAFISFYYVGGNLFDTLIVKTVKTVLSEDKYFIGHDLEAEVVAYRDNDDNAHLKVNGIGMTFLTTDTKLMAHLPMFLNDSSKRLLNIAFGMGTTYRSSLKHGLDVDAVELIPSVPDALHVFHEDAQEILDNPRGNIYINDGYNYVSLIDKKYDIITVDPPPPVNSVGTTVLYSEEFYEKSKKILNSDGMFVQWVYSAMSKQDALIIIKTFLEAFPHVSIWDSPDRVGVYLVGSFENIEPNLEKFKAGHSKEGIAEDINEWTEEDITAEDMYNLRLNNECIASALSDYPTVSNDKPIIEYYMWRNIFNHDSEKFIEFLENNCY
ncbi:fused MFS/spermidine synthase [Candidatus Parcubacteria bacterium]|jgi:spermidine synthase|nr:fused MFS/spermidine synthase [Candidatus Parcubacteria bacterium]